MSKPGRNPYRILVINLQQQRRSGDLFGLTYLEETFQDFDARISTTKKNENNNQRNKEEVNIVQDSKSSKNNDKKGKNKKSYDNLICWICNQKGHGASSCPPATLEEKLDAY